MLEGILKTAYGQQIPNTGRLFAIGGAVSVAAAAETALTIPSANEFGYLCYLRADCIILGVTGGTWELHLAAGGAGVMHLQMPVVAVPVGTSYCWPFPVPWKTTAKNGQFTLTPSVATMGTWMFTLNGFRSSI